MKVFESLDRGTQRLIEWQYHCCGDFTRELFQIIARADPVNLERLRRGFPLEVEAFVNYSRVAGWWQAIERELFNEL